MHYKIASIILNSAKSAGLSDVYVAQPDSVKENLAGKVFILAEINGKKTEGRKVFDFLVLALNDNYYNDEKILFRDKIEGLKLENIFEAAVAKTNKNLIDFLASEKIRLNPEATNITLGVICDNKLFFANFGRNRALLVYRHGDNYELINVEANAAESPEAPENEAGSKTTQLFSSVISGEVPPASYFIFTSEALPEYLSGSEMIGIVTKLPPMTAAEQIKNVLAKINSYVPFLGIIIKNTTGLNQTSDERSEESEEYSSAHSSISSLNYTEQKTEQMLSPAGLINFPKLFRQAKDLVASWLIPPAPSSGRNVVYKHKEEQKEAGNQTPQIEKRPTKSGPLELGKINSLNGSLKNLRQDSFLIKDKMFFKKKSSWLVSSLSRFIRALINWFDPRRWPLIAKGLKSWVLSLNRKNKAIFAVLAAVILLFIASTYYLSWNNERAALEEQFNQQLAALEDKEAQIESYLLYDDQAAANRTIIEAMDILASLPHNTEEQKEKRDNLLTRFEASKNRILKIKTINEISKVNDLSGLGVQSLVTASGKLLAASRDTVYELTPNSASSTKTAVSGAENLSQPNANGELVYFWDNNRVIQFNASTKNSVVRSFTQPQNSELTGFRIYRSNNNLYTINKTNNQIFRYNSSGGSFGAKTDWLGQSVDLSRATDLEVDGDIYVLLNTGQVLKFRLNKPQEYDSLAVSPSMSAADGLVSAGDRLYFFDAPTKRLVAITKSNGSLLQQYQIDSLFEPKDFAVDEQAKKAYFLDGEAVYQISLE